MTPEELLIKIQKIDWNILAEQSINATSTAFAKKNTEQMYAGKLNTGEDITPEYAASTKQRKKAKRQPEKVTLKDTGKFYRGYKANAKGGFIVLQSDVEYEKYLDKRYSDKIHGLNPSSMEVFIDEFLLPAFMQGLEETTGL